MELRKTRKFPPRIQVWLTILFARIRILRENIIKCQVVHLHLFNLFFSSEDVSDLQLRAAGISLTSDASDQEQEETDVQVRYLTYISQ